MGLGSSNLVETTLQVRLYISFYHFPKQCELQGCTLFSLLLLPHFDRSDARKASMLCTDFVRLLKICHHLELFLVIGLNVFQELLYERQD